MKPAELEMARQLIERMTSAWQPAQFKDDFTSAVRRLVEKKAKAGEKARVAPLEETPELVAPNVVELSELLRRSLGAKAGGARRAGGKNSKPTPRAKATGAPASKPAAA